jgi:NAD(P)-dependent dehydrogenase (short-subunit alcohol dehydrogenase family)
MPTYPVANKTVFITGAAGGIGAATARALHARGANVVLADLGLGGVTALARDLGDDCALALSVDVTDTAALTDAMDRAVHRFGGLDVVFANAGIAADPPATIATIDPATFERVVEVDLLGVWRTVRVALPHIVAARGHVLVTASVYAYFNGMVNAPYAMAKAGVEQFGRALRAELSIHGATAGVLYPGWVHTPIAQVAFGGNEIVTRLREVAYPSVLGKTIAPEQVAERAVRGIEHRSARVMVPRRWEPVSALRGILNPLTDLVVGRHPQIRRLVQELEESAGTPTPAPAPVA